MQGRPQKMHFISMLISSLLIPHSVYSTTINQSSSKSSSRLRNFSRKTAYKDGSQIFKNVGVPTNRALAVLCNRYGLCLTITESGDVVGQRDITDERCVVEVQALTAHVKRIKACKSGRYLAVNTSGKLYTTELATDETWFREHLEENNYVTYKSVKYRSPELAWYIGIKQNRKVKIAKRNSSQWKALQFMILRVHRKSNKC